jgi:hypothetical protein
MTHCRYATPAIRKCFGRGPLSALPFIQHWAKRAIFQFDYSEQVGILHHYLAQTRQTRNDPRRLRQIEKFTRLMLRGDLAADVAQHVPQPNRKSDTNSAIRN